MNSPNPIFTVGHSNHSIERFIELLSANAIAAIADVRSTPYSQYTPQFNREPLQAALKVKQIGYVFMGRELGARREEPECYQNDQARYDRIAKTSLFREGLQRLTTGSGQRRIALMCAEKDPITCHRAILVSRNLRPREIAHILDDGKLESNAEMERRLLKETGIGGGLLFMSDQEAVELAYDAQGERIAYTRSAVNAEERG